MSERKKVAFFSMNGDSSIIKAIAGQDFEAKSYYCMRNDEQVFPAFGGDYEVIDWSQFAVAIIDCGHLAQGLEYSEIIRLLTAKGVPCVAMTASGHNEGMLEAGAVSFVYRRALADKLFDHKLKLSDCKLKFSDLRN